MSELQRSTFTGETAIAAVATQARATIEARYLVAHHRPREREKIREMLLADCTRPHFAAVARYRKPMGDRHIDGPSIRFAEAALRHMTNVLPETTTVFDNEQKRILRVSVTDLESNVTYAKDVTVEKSVERSKLRPGQAALKTRINASGRTVHLVQATEEELLNKENALVPKTLRNLALRLIPADIVEECMAKVVETLEIEASTHGQSEKIATAFAALGVSNADLEMHLGHALESVTPREVADLKALYAAIRDGEATFPVTSPPSVSPKTLEALMAGGET